jgi:hypothetical protein
MIFKRMYGYLIFQILLVIYHLPDPTFAFVGGPCCPTLDFVIAFWTMVSFYTLLTSLFCICQICRAMVENDSKNSSIHHISGRVIHGDQGMKICDACCKGDRCNKADCFALRKSKCISLVEPYGSCVRWRNSELSSEYSTIITEFYILENHKNLQMLTFM